MRATVALLMTICLLGLAACGGGDDSGTEREPDATDQTSTAPTTTETTPAETAPEEEAEAPFSATYVFSGDEVQKCIEGEGLTAPREDEPAPEDKVGQGIVHDRLMVGARGAEPALRLFMFGAADLAEEQGKLVTERTPGAEVLGTTILEPLAGDAPKETAVVLGCLKEQAGG
jgi:hypothetical protein